MAIGTITPGASSHSYVAGNKRHRIRDVQLTAGANYVQGGTAITAAQLGMHVINTVFGGEVATTSNGSASLPVAWKVAANGLSVSFFVFAPSTGAEQAANADLSTYSVRATFVGRG